MKQLIIFPTGTMPALDEQRMLEAGFIAIEHDNPDKVVALIPSSPLLNADDLLLSAVNAISGANSADEQRRFALNLIAKINANASAKKASA